MPLNPQKPGAFNFTMSGKVRSSERTWEEVMESDVHKYMGNQQGYKSICIKKSKMMVRRLKIVTPIKDLVQFPHQSQFSDLDPLTKEVASSLGGGD